MTKQDDSTGVFLVSILYVQPEFEELVRRYPDYVNIGFKGHRFDPIDRCRAVSRATREVTFEYIHLSRPVAMEEALVEMSHRGFGPALYEELLGFAERHPDEQRKHPIVALGSVSQLRGGDRVPFLWSTKDGRGLHLSGVDKVWSGSCRFLAVRR